MLKIIKFERSISIMLVIQVSIFTTVFLLQSTYAEDHHGISSHTDKNYLRYLNGYNLTSLSDNKGHSELAKLTTIGNKVYAVWIDDSSGQRDIYFRKSIDNGCNFGATIDVNSQKGGSTDPQIATSAENVYLVWEQTPGNNGAVFFSKSTDNGTSFERIRNISNNTGFKGFPEIAASGKNVYLVWHDASHGILFKRSVDNGTTFKEIKNIGGDNGSNTAPQISVSGENVYLTWINNSLKNQHIYFSRSTDNGVSFTTPVELGEHEDKKYGMMIFKPRIAADPKTSTVYVVWHAGKIIHQNTANVDALISDVLFARSTDNGASFDKTINLSNYSGWSIDPQIAVSQNNTIYVVWTNNATGNEEIVLKHSVSNNCSSKNHESKLVNIKAVENSFFKNIKIGFVDPTFTFAAYDNSFYLFYDISKSLSRVSNFTQYTDLLTSKVPGKPYALKESDDIMLHLKWLLPKSDINFITDQDVHNGLIFDHRGLNQYDVLILSHQEYVTQIEYDNLKKFVSNGGVLILLDGNVLYAEVKYDNATDTVRLVKGHNWAFNGKSAWKSVGERWPIETSQWIGSNYLCCYDDDIVFNNNPFDAKHNEEQYVTNAHVKILLDYNATENKPNPRKFTVATYEMDHERGKVLTMGLYTDDLKENERFWRFFDSLIFQYVLGQSTSLK
jgi:N,N-dimethylformamidase beta subunit-like protein